MGNKKKRPSESAWEGAKGWQEVDVGEDFLLGSSEYGFMGLEVLDPSDFDGAVIESGELYSTERDGRKKQNANKSADTEVKDKQQDVEQLKARVKELEAENKALRKKRKSNDGELDGSVAPKKASKAGKAAAAKQTEESTKMTSVDVSAWSDFQLDSRIMTALADIGFSAPTHVQAECIPAAIRDRRDIIGAAQTGSGKTLAFGLPIIHMLAHANQEAAENQDAHRSLRALVLAPTRELAMQVCSHLQVIAKQCGVWVVPIVGGISSEKQERLLSKRPEVVVATPGRLWDLMREGNHHVASLRGLQYLVIDEADRMVQQGHYAELSSILGAIPGASGSQDGDVIGINEEEEDDDLVEKRQPRSKAKSNEPSLQTFVFSATLTLPSELRRRLRKGGGGASGSATLESLMDKLPFRGRGRPKIVDLTSERKVADKVTEAFIACSDDGRDDALYCLLAAHPGRTIVFVNAVSAVRRLGALLKLLALPVYPLHAGMQQRARLKALDRFKADSNAVLVATDVAARGLDVKAVRCVVHYQVPASVDVYVHRSGRTARAEEEGLAVALVTPKEDARFRALIKALNRDVPTEFPLDLTLMPAVRERVRLALRLDSLERGNSKQRAEKSWKALHAEELGLELSDEEIDEEEQLQNRRKRAQAPKIQVDGEIAGLKAQLSTLLAEPLRPKFSEKFFTGGAAAGLAVQQRVGVMKNGKSEDEAVREGAVTVSKAVAAAQRLVNSRSAARQKNDEAGPVRKSKLSRAEALKSAIRKQMEKKSGKGKKGGIFVVPQAMGRDSLAPDALEALRSRTAR